jgi:hypothetical protein
VPNAEVVIEQNQGHLSDPEVVVERYSWLVR